MDLESGGQAYNVATISSNYLDPLTSESLCALAGYIAGCSADFAGWIILESCYADPHC